MNHEENTPLAVPLPDADPFQRGTEALHAGRFDEAAEWLETAAEGSAAVQAALAEARIGQRRHEDARLLAEGLVKQDPKNIEYRGLLGAALAYLDEPVEAERLLAKTPDRLVFHLARAVTLARSGDLDDAERAARRAQGFAPNHVEVLAALGDVLTAQGRHGEALTVYGQALKIDPLYVPARLGRGRLRLALGDFRAWSELDWRLNAPGLAPEFNPEGPAWDGAAPAGKTLLLIAEPDSSETLMFIRYAAVLKRLGARIVLACRPELKTLLARAVGVDRVVTEASELTDEPVDAHADLLSLPALLGTGPSSMPRDVYLTPDPTQASRWASILAALGGYRVAIHWANNRPDRRSIPLDAFAPLAEVSNARLVSVQKGRGERELSSARFTVDVLSEIDAGSESDAFEDVAAVLAGSDLVVTNDGAIAHLAGALGAPTWVILPVGPDWRWLTERSDSPWYPSLHLFRQRRQGDWSAPFAEAAAALQAGVATREAVWASRAK